eukprot:TRINITY_DN56579_c0_g1_i1.p1 TRINITY_DN56579_c0_g1~~TRINITY_DN56579_c0_g1_i1.p1  ORF type:complete len:627 (-),score=117.46 TRINITY_DN56579_c0_g1_i1:43-1923(-)
MFASSKCDDCETFRAGSVVEYLDTGRQRLRANCLETANEKSTLLACDERSETSTMLCAREDTVASVLSGADAERSTQVPPPRRIRAEELDLELLLEQVVRAVRLPRLLADGRLVDPNYPPVCSVRKPTAGAKAPLRSRSSNAFGGCGFRCPPTSQDVSAGFRKCAFDVALLAFYFLIAFAMFQAAFTAAVDGDDDADSLAARKLLLLAPGTLSMRGADVLRIGRQLLPAAELTDASVHTDAVRIRLTFVNMKLTKIDEQGDRYAVEMALRRAVDASLSQIVNSEGLAVERISVSLLPDFMPANIDVTVLAQLTEHILSERVRKTILETQVAQAIARQLERLPHLGRYLVAPLEIADVGIDVINVDMTEFYLPDDRPKIFDAREGDVLPWQSPQSFIASSGAWKRFILLGGLLSGIVILVKAIWELATLVFDVFTSFPDITSHSLGRLNHDLPGVVAAIFKQSEVKSVAAGTSVAQVLHHSLLEAQQSLKPRSLLPWHLLSEVRFRILVAACPLALLGLKFHADWSALESIGVLDGNQPAWRALLTSVAGRVLLRSVLFNATLGLLSSWPMARLVSNAAFKASEERLQAELLSKIFATFDGRAGFFEAVDSALTRACDAPGSEKWVW